MASQRIQHLLRAPENERRFALPFDDLVLAWLYAARIDFNRCAKRAGPFTGSQRSDEWNCSRNQARAASDRGGSDPKPSLWVCGNGASGGA